MDPEDDPKEIQANEIEVLKSILMDDFQLIEPASVWKNAPKLHEFKVQLLPLDEELKPLVRLTLHVRLPKTYPRAVPTFSLLSPTGLSPSHVAQLDHLLHAKARELVGQEMIWELVSLAQDFITANNSASKGGKNVSLNEEMQRRADEAEKAEQRRAAAEASEAAQREAARSLELAQLIQDDVRRKEAMLQQEKEKRRGQVSDGDGDSDARRSVASDVSIGGLETFEDGVSVDEGERCKAVRVGPVVHRGPLSHTHFAQPVDHGFSEDGVSWLLEVYDITSPYYQHSGKRKLQEVEKELDRLRGIRHTSLVNVLQAKLVRVQYLEASQPAAWKLSILTERCERGSTLDCLLQMTGELKWERAKEYLGQILCALDCLHSNNLCHRGKWSRLSPMTIQVSAGQAVSVKLVGAGYRRRMADLHRSNSLNGPEDVEDDLSEGWRAPESLEHPFVFTRKRDVWDLGRVLLQMLYGLDIIHQYASPEQVLRASGKSIGDSVAEVLAWMFEPLPKKRASVTDLASRLSALELELSIIDREPPTEGLPFRGSLFAQPPSEGYAKGKARSPGPPKVLPFGTSPPGLASFWPTNDPRPGSFWQLRHALPLPGSSRYRNDFDEVEFLGKGGFGEVVKARNRLDGRFYAIKKIKLSGSVEGDERTLREVTALSRLNHPHIVRYTTCWIESNEDRTEPLLSDTSFSEQQTSEGSLAASDDDIDEEDLAAAFEDDFLSVGHDAFSKSASYPHIHFGNESDSSSDEDEEPHPPPSRRGKPRRGMLSKPAAHSLPPPPKFNRTLYIQMEFVEKQTLKEAIEEGISEEQAWKILRQMTEAMVHVSSLGIIHRDLKPSNILMYGNGDIKIGDFGLATTNVQAVEVPEHLAISTHTELSDLTSNIGTSLYVAPEVTASTRGGPKYNHKVDMFSMGIIFFEMLASGRCYSTGMERIVVLRELRKLGAPLPPSWPSNRLVNQTKIIRWLLQHDPADRPTPLELLRSDLLPPKMEDEFVEECLRLMASMNSPYHDQLLTALFSRSELDPVRDFTFEAGADSDQDDALTLVVLEHLRLLFRSHGAVHMEAPLLLPPNDCYQGREKRPVQLLDKTGRVVLLPYDLTVPFARIAARSEERRLKRYVIGKVYRENFVAGGQPRAVLEVDFDIVSPLRTAAAEAEILALVDEILDFFPGLSTTNWQIHISHANVVDIVLERVPAKHRRGVLNTLSQLGQKATMAQVRSQLSKNYKLPRSIIDELETFDVCGPIDNISERLDRLVAREDRGKWMAALTEIKDVIKTTQHLGVHRKILFSPLLQYNVSLYKGGTFFQVVKPGKRKDVIAAGGRYDHLIKKFSSPTMTHPPSHAVGVQIAVEKIALALSKYQTLTVPRLVSLPNEIERSFGVWTPRRCDVYVASGRDLLGERLELCRELWAHKIAADLMYDDAIEASPEETAKVCRKEGILFLVLVKHKGSVVKVKNVLRREEDEVPRAELPVWLITRIAEQHRIDALTASGSSLRTRTDSASGWNGGTPTVGLSNATLSGVPPGAMERLGSTSVVGTGAMGHAQYGVVAPPDITLLLAREAKKIKHSHKQLLLDKASAHMSSLTDAVVSGTIPVVAVEFSSPIAFRRLCADGAVLSDDAFRGVLDALPVGEREYAEGVRRAILKHAQKEKDPSTTATPRVWLYHIKEDRSALVTLA